MRIWRLGFRYLLFICAALLLTSALAQGNRVPIYYFWGDGCPRCAEMKPFLEDLERRYPNIEIHAFEVWYQPQNRPLFTEMAAAAGIEASGVPTTFIGGQVWVGYHARMNPEIERAIRECSQVQCFDYGEGRVQQEELLAVPPAAETPASQGVLELPLIGSVNLAAQSLLLSTGLIAFVDGFNPCSLWVLSILLALVLHSGSRRRIALVGLTFLTVTAAIYGVFMLGLFSVFSYVSYLPWLQVLVALFALAFALINIKDFFFYKQGVSLTISDKYKPGIYKGFRSLLAPDRSAFTLVGATAAMAAGIALVELPCTAGFPVLWSNILAGQGVNGTTFGLLLSLYLGVYLLDEILVFGVAVVTLRASRLEEKHGRALKLVGGMIMLALALVLVFSPETMNSIAGSLLIFGLALASSLAIMLVHRLVLPRPIGVKAAVPRPKRQS